jgi:Domain of unknown function (DUF4249)
MNALFRGTKGIFVCALLFWLTGCVKTIDLQVVSFQKQVVLVGVLNPDSLIAVRVSYSNRPDSVVVYQYINEAKVFFYEDGHLIGQLTKGNKGLYKLSQKPIEGRRYGVRVQVIGYADVTAEDTIPERPLIALTKSGKNPLNPNENSDYELFVQNKDLNKLTGLWFGAYTTATYNIVSSSSFFKFASMEYLNILSNSPYLDRFNSFFDGLNGRYTFGDPVRIDLSSFRLDKTASIPLTISNQILKTEKASLYVYSMSLVYDSYLKSAITAYQNRLFDSSGAINNPFAEPTPVYGNITNGLGIWAAYSSVRKDM